MARQKTRGRKSVKKPPGGKAPRKQPVAAVAKPAKPAKPAKKIQFRKGSKSTSRLVQLISTILIYHSCCTPRNSPLPKITRTLDSQASIYATCTRDLTQHRCFQNISLAAKCN